MMKKSMTSKTKPERSLVRSIAADREWFEHHPNATVRFRPQGDGEFSELTEQGHTIPTFIPSGFKSGSPLMGVAVVDLTRLTGCDQSQGPERIRVRIRTVTIRSRKHREKVAKELQRAVTEELITLTDDIGTPIRQFDNPKLPDDLAAS